MIGYPAKRFQSRPKPFHTRFLLPRRAASEGDFGRSLALCGKFSLSKSVNKVLFQPPNGARKLPKDVSIALRPLSGGDLPHPKEDFAWSVPIGGASSFWLILRFSQR